MQIAFQRQRQRTKTKVFNIINCNWEEKQPFLANNVGMHLENCC